MHHHQRSAMFHSPAETADYGDELVMVSWRATASWNMVESTARQCGPVRILVAVMGLGDGRGDVVRAAPEVQQARLNPPKLFRAFPT